MLDASRQPVSLCWFLRLAGEWVQEELVSESRAAFSAEGRDCIVLQLAEDRGGGWHGAPLMG